MDKKIMTRVLVIAASVLVLIYFLVPSFIYYAKTPAEREEYVRENPQILGKIVNLGLDLQGGMRLVLEVDRSGMGKDEGKDLLDRAYTVIENRINALGVAEPTIQKQGKDRIIVELPGLKDERQAKSVIGKTAQLSFMLVREPAQLEHALRIIDNTLAGKIDRDSAAADSAAKAAVEKQSLAEKIFKGQEEEDTAAEVDNSEAAERSEKPGLLKDYLVQLGDQIGVKRGEIPRVKDLLNRSDVRSSLERAGLGGNVFLWSHDTLMANGEIYRSLYYLKGSPEMTGDKIKDASATLDPSGLTGGAKVDLEMTGPGARRFAAVTANNVNRFLAIVLDSTVYSAPRIIQKISLGRAEITGRFSMKEATELAVVLRAGALPAPMTIIEEQAVGPSLGQDSIDKAVVAGWVALLFILLFMPFYYRLSGAIALLALSINILAVLSIMAMMNATLTLPGIAGLILQLGMGIDANVIIFERIREETTAGKTPRAAINSGYKAAFWTIFDSNFTTLITAFILLWKGTGAIRGFAITLILGIIANLFTALFVTRVAQDIAVTRKNAKLSI